MNQKTAEIKTTSSANIKAMPQETIIGKHLNCECNDCSIRVYFVSCIDRKLV